MKIKRGITRTVFVTRRWAIKVPSLRAHGLGVSGVLWSISRGLSANLSEREWSGQRGFCPLHFSLWGVVNVYPRADVCTEADEPIDYATIADYPLAVDPKPHNVGRLNGELVWIDYDMNWNDCLACSRQAARQTTGSG